MTLTGLLGGSFNPAHDGHRRVGLAAIDELGLDELWWLVSPGNPLKDAKTLAPLSARLQAARIVARRSRIRPTDIEARLGTRYTIDTVRALIRRYPNRRFIWIIGADIIGEFHRWRDWRKLARLVPIAVTVRPGYRGLAGASPAAAWLRRFVRPLSHRKDWTRWTPPAIVLLHMAPNSSSATALRRASPDWHHRFPVNPLRPRPRFP
ncbi:MAG: nicotinate-nucleotide adenylyltransferase [Sphingomonadales bacterium]